MKNDLQLTHECINGIARQVRYISIEETKALLDEFQRTEALMPFLDPTGYRTIMKNIPDHRRVVAAFLAFQQEIEAVVTAGDPQ